MTFKRHNPGCPCCEEISSSSLSSSSFSSSSLIEFCAEPTPRTLYITAINPSADCACVTGMGSVAISYVASTIYGGVGPGYQVLDVPMGCGSRTLDFVIKCEPVNQLRLFVNCPDMLGPLSRFIFPSSYDPFLASVTAMTNFRQCCGLAFGTTEITFVITE